jgi:hypothetical protein
LFLSSDGESINIASAIVRFSLTYLTFIPISDYVRLTFGAANDNPDIFPNDEYFGLGLFRHQDFSSNKTASTWEHSGSCYDFTDLDTEMFRSSNVKTAGNLFIPALVLSAVSLLSVLAMKCKGVQSSCMMVFTILATTTSAILQIVVFTVMFRASGRNVCSIDRYAANIDDQWAWYIDYPSPLFPYVAYMRFMQGCDLRSTAKIAIEYARDLTVRPASLVTSKRSAVSD